MAIANKPWQDPYKIYMEKYKMKKGKVAPENIVVYPGAEPPPPLYNLADMLDDPWWKKPKPMAPNDMLVINNIQPQLDVDEFDLPPPPNPEKHELFKVKDELKEMINQAKADGVEPPLSLIRAYNALSKMEGDNYQYYYDMGYNDGKSDAKELAAKEALAPEPEDDDDI